LKIVDSNQLPKPFQNNNLLTWIGANGAAMLPAYLTDKPIALSWEQVKIANPNLAHSLKQAGLSPDRMPQAWKSDPALLDARGAGVYAHNIPDAIARLGPDAIDRFKQGKHWSHQTSYSEGLERGWSKAELADPSNGIFEEGLSNVRRGAREMPDGWGDAGNPGKLQIQFLNELEAVRLVSQYAAHNALRGFTYCALEELIFSTVEVGLAYQRNELSIADAAARVTEQSLNVGLQGAIAAAVITGTCAYVPGAGLLMSAVAPVLVGMGVCGRLARVYQTYSKHLERQGFAAPVDFYGVDVAIADLDRGVARLTKPQQQMSAAYQRMLQEYDAKERQVQEFGRFARLAVQQQREDLARQALQKKRRVHREMEELRAAMTSGLQTIQAGQNQANSLKAKISRAKIERQGWEARLESAALAEQMQRSLDRADRIL